MKKTVLAFSAAMLWCASAFAMQPVEGLYEKVDANGNVVARLQCWEAVGSVGREGQAWGSDNPYISLQGFKNGKETYQIGTSYSKVNADTGSADSAIVLQERECNKVNDYQEVVGERWRNLLQFTWKSDNEVSVDADSFDEILSGSYRRVDKLRELPISMLIYAYENNQDPSAFQYGAPEPKNKYSIAPVHGAFALQYFKIKNKNDNWEMNFYAENDFNLIIEADGVNGRDYYFPFVHKNFLSRTENTWGGIQDPGNFKEGATMAAFRKLKDFEPFNDVLPGTRGCLQYTDFYKAKVEYDKYIHRFTLKESLVEPGWLTKATIDYGNDGTISIQRYFGPATVNGTEIRFRNGASSNAAILGEMQNGETVKCNGYIAGPSHNWAYITRNNGQSGFMAMEYLQGIEKN